jgi:hypothetical protein
MTERSTQRVHNQLLAQYNILGLQPNRDSSRRLENSWPDTLTTEDITNASSARLWAAAVYWVRAACLDLRAGIVVILLARENMLFDFKGASPFDC